jgi:hypothetical protein
MNRYIGNSSNNLEGLDREIVIAAVRIEVVALTRRFVDDDGFIEGKEASKRRRLEDSAPTISRAYDRGIADARHLLVASRAPRRHGRMQVPQPPHERRLGAGGSGHAASIEHAAKRAGGGT